MKNIREQLNEINPAMFKKLSWIRLDLGTPFYNELHPEWYNEFKSALEALPGIQVLGSGTANALEYHINVVFMKPESHLEFIHSFYIDGMVKKLFKDNMSWATQNKIAFNMASVLPSTWNPPKGAHNLKAHVLYEIRPEGEKFQAATRDHRDSFDFFQWMLFLENTCSISAWYDHNHQARHIQTLYLNYDEKVHSRIVEETKKYPSFFEKRYDYNNQKNIIHKQGMISFEGMIDKHMINEKEFIDHLPFHNRPFVIDLL